MFSIFISSSAWLVRTASANITFKCYSWKEPCLVEYLTCGIIYCMTGIEPLWDEVVGHFLEVIFVICFWPYDSHKHYDNSDIFYSWLIVLTIICGILGLMHWINPYVLFWVLTSFRNLHHWNLVMHQLMWGLHLFKPCFDPLDLTT